MISNFPKFKKLSVKDKIVIDSITSPFPPYSDFNFMSLWAWDISNKTEISMLNGNLVVKFKDYLSSRYFYSFIGTNKITETIYALLSKSREEGMKEELRLIPSHNFSKLDIKTLASKFSISEEIDNHDYIFAINKLSKMDGRALHHKRKLFNRFAKSCDPKVLFLSLSDGSVKKEVIEFFKHWETNKSKQKVDTLNEFRAIKRLFLLPKTINTFVQCVYVNYSLTGFTIFELLNNKYVLSNFQKGDINYRGIYEFLYQNMAEFLEKNGYSYLNVEQDLGIEGIRRAKLDYKPVAFLKKYTVAVK